MALGITVADNLDDDSPGVDFVITGLTPYDEVTVERIDTSGEYSAVPVRGFDQALTDATMAGSDYEAPINRPLQYRVNASGDTPNITYFATGGVSFGQTSCTPSYPLNTQSDDINILNVSIKPYNATISTPAGWTLLQEHTNGSVASGFGIGSVKMYSFYRVGAFTGTVTITPSTATIVAAEIVAFRKTGAGAWVVSSVEGGDSTHGANFSAGATSALTVSKVGDVLVGAAGVNSDAGTASDFLLTLPNSGLSATTLITESKSNQFHTYRFASMYATVGLSTSSGQPLLTYTNASDGSGVAMFTRLSADSSSSETVTSSTVTIGYDSIGDAWIKSVSTPQLSKKVAVVDWKDTEYTTRVLSTYKVLGRPKPVVLTDRWGAREGEITVVTDNDYFSCTWQQLNQLIIDGKTLLFQTVGSDVTGEKDMFFEVSSFSRSRQGLIRADGTVIYYYKIGFIEVDRPATSEESLGLRSYQDVLDQNGTYQDILDQYVDPDDTYLALLISSPP